MMTTSIDPFLVLKPTTILTDRSERGGLDMSLEETSVCIVDETGRIVKEVRVATELHALVATLRKIGLTLERIGLEACSLTA